MSNSVTAIFKTYNPNENVSFTNISPSEIDWGDGTITSGSNTLNHTYDSAGTYTCKISGITVIGQNAFSNESCRSALTQITCNDSLAGIGASAFYCCSSLEKVTLLCPSLSLASAAFYGCIGLKTLILPEGLKTIPNNAFTASNINTLTLPDSVETIAGSAFSNTSSLKEVQFGSKLKTIASKAFDACNNLSKITFIGSTPPTDLELDSFPTNKTIAVYVPQQAEASYVAALSSYPNLYVVTTGSGSNGNQTGGGSGDTGGSTGGTTAVGTRHVTIEHLKNYNTQLKTNYIDKLAEKLTKQATDISNRIYSVSPAPSGGLAVSTSSMVPGEGDAVRVAIVGLSTTETFILDGGTSSSVS